MTLGTVIKERFGDSQKAFAKAAGIDEGQLSKYLAAERGEEQGQTPSAENLARIEKATKGKVGSAHWARVKARLRALRERDCPDDCPGHA
jgi:transcriptional regulator with XRE-family HTH domain